MVLARDARPLRARLDGVLGDGVELHVHVVLRPRHQVQPRSARARGVSVDQNSNTRTRTHWIKAGTSGEQTTCTSTGREARMRIDLSMCCPSRALFSPNMTSTTAMCSASPPPPAPPALPCTPVPLPGLAPNHATLPLPPLPSPLERSSLGEGPCTSALSRNSAMNAADTSATVRREGPPPSPSVILRVCVVVVV